MGGFIGTPEGSGTPQYFKPAPGSQHIQFQPGSTSVVVTGQVVPRKVDEWIIQAKAGQTLSTKLTFSSGEATLIISSADGSVLQVDQDRATRFTGVIPTSQDYYINVIGNYQTSTNYSLTVSLQ
jgi:hypothetical protein